MAALDRDLSRDKEQAGVQSIETGMRLLLALAETTHAQPLKALAEASAMPAAKAHRYLVSFIRMQFVERDQATSGYRLGPASVQVGLAAIASLNLVRLAAPELRLLRDTLGLTVALAVWGTYGPTYVLVEEPIRTIAIDSKPGTVLPLSGTATGRVFAAFLPNHLTAALLQREIGSAPSPRHDAFATLLAKVRNVGFAWSHGEHTPHIYGMSAPLFDHQAQLRGALTIIGGKGEFETAPDGPVAIALRQSALRLSRSMGFRGAEQTPAISGL